MNRKEVLALGRAVKAAEVKYQQAVNEYNDGFVYIVIVYCYGIRERYAFHSDIACKQELGKWYDDNGIARCITNNPKFRPETHTREITVDNDPESKAEEI